MKTARVDSLHALALLAVAIAVIALSFGHSATQDTEAATNTGGTANLAVTGGGWTDNGGGNFSGSGKGTVSINFPTLPAGGLCAWQTQIVTTGGVSFVDGGAPPIDFKNPGDLSVRSIVATTIGHGDVFGLINCTPDSTKGAYLNLSFNVTGDGTITLVPASGTNPAGTVLVGGAGNDIPNQDVLTFTHQTPTPTPIPTSFLRTPTMTPLPTNTPVAPAIVKSPALSNIFLTAQGTKVPPATCLGGTDGAVLTQSLSTAVDPTEADKHGDPRDLGGFSFKVNYDETKVCVQIVPGPLASAWVAGGGSCIVFDSVTKPSLQGSASIACNQLGKDDVSLGVGGDALTLANVIVQPMPDEYSVMTPNNGNGNVVQIINKACKLTDQQGDPIPPAAGDATCTDADITIRYLEGDVVPDCSINTLDTQAVAFRWGSQKGALLYGDFFNNEPSKPQGDDDIDINDLQFVYGRFGSSCSGPQQPPQPPVNAKAGV